MIYVGGKYKLSKDDITTGCISCPDCANPLEPHARRSAFVCHACMCVLETHQIGDLPDDLRKPFEQRETLVEKVESLKEVVDELQKRGDTKDAYALANLLTALTPSAVAVPAHVVEACRLLDLAEGRLSAHPAQAARIAGIRHEIQKGDTHGYQDFRKSERAPNKTDGEDGQASTTSGKK